MDCKHTQNLINSCFTGDIDPSPVDHASLEAHLSACEACRVEYRRSQQALGLVKRYGKLNLDTIQLLETTSPEGRDHLRLVSEEMVEISDAQVEAGLAGLMAMIDQKEQTQEPHRPMTLEEGVSDLRRRVNTIEAYQADFREGWQHSSGGQDTVASPSNWQRKLYYATGIAACLTVAAVLGWMSLSPPLPGRANLAEVNSEDVAPLVQWVTADGTQPIPVGETIRSGNQYRELLLGGLHRVVMNTDSTATVDAQDGVFTIDLAQGELYVEVVPGASQGFVVMTPNARLTITGTKFNVNADDQQTELTLLKGSVRFTSLEGSDFVDVLAGRASRVIGRSTPTTPQHVDALATTAWARQVAVGNAIARIHPSLGQFDVDDLFHDALVTDMPDYRHWSYERFRDEHREWFAKEFPWAMEIEKTLQEDHGLDADYLDILVVSGDIWQFDYTGTRHISGPIPAFNPAAIERLANWYGLEAQPLLDTLRQHSKTQSLADHTGEAFAGAIEHWRSDIVQADQHKFEDLALFSLKASAYLAHTRAALYLWIQEHPEEAARLLASDDYADTFLASPMTTSTDQKPSASTLLAQIGRQIDASADCYQQTQQFLMVPGTGPCPADEWAEMQRRFDEGLKRISIKWESDPQ